MTISETPSIIFVRTGASTEPQLYWHRVRVAEWHSNADPRKAAVEEEILLFDRGRHRHVLERHRYGAGIRREREWADAGEQAIARWIDRRGDGILWREDAAAFLPAFVRPEHAANEPIPRGASEVA